MASTKILHGDCLDILRRATSNSVDSIVTDPPYGLSFMGKKWDYDVPSKEIWQECLRVLKPGGYLLSFAGTRTQHRMAVNIEDAGFEIRDMIAWVYGSGFPKSLNIGKAVDKLQGNEREIVGIQTNIANKGNNSDGRYNWNTENQKRIDSIDITKGNSEWEGWGTALKPALEPITVARKPLEQKTVAENVLKWGTGGINIDGSRVETTDKYSYPNGAGGNSFSVGEEPDGKRTEPVESNSLGRFPANLIHDGSDEVVSLFPETKSGGGNKANKLPKNRNSQVPSTINGGDWKIDSGNASRFFKSIIYQAKASKSDRDEGLEGFEEIRTGGMQATADGSMLTGSGNERTTKRANHHPTVKPTKLMQYLVKLVTPKGGTCLDPFMGSGSTGKACKLEGFDFIGIEREEEYIKIAEARINCIV